MFDIEKCKICPFRNGCYKEGAKSKVYSVTIKSTEHREQEAFQDSEEFKMLAKERYKIEAKNSELKHRHGYDEASSAGLLGMENQGATAIFVVNSTSNEFSRSLSRKVTKYERNRSLPVQNRTESDLFLFEKQLLTLKRKFFSSLVQYRNHLFQAVLYKRYILFLLQTLFLAFGLHVNLKQSLIKTR